MTEFGFLYLFFAGGREGGGVRDCSNNCTAAVMCHNQEEILGHIPPETPNRKLKARHSSTIDKKKIKKTSETNGQHCLDLPRCVRSKMASPT